MLKIRQRTAARLEKIDLIFKEFFCLSGIIITKLLGNLSVQPKTVIPVHTQHPEVFQTLHDNVILPEKGIPIRLSLNKQHS
jgi:hypothetical protein